MFLSVCTLPTQPRCEVAYIARRYFPPGDHRISRSYAWVCDRYGRNRRRVAGPFPSEGSVDIYWLDRHTIAWIARSEYVTRVGGFNLSTGKRILAPITQPSVPESSQRVDSRKNSAFVEVGDDGTCRVVSPSLDKSFRLSGYSHLQISLDEDTVFLTTLELERPTLYCSVYRISLNTGRPNLIVKNMGVLDIAPDSAVYAVAGPRELTPYGKVSVYTASAWVGNWKTGKKWLVEGGLVYVSAISILR